LSPFTRPSKDFLVCRIRKRSAGPHAPAEISTNSSTSSDADLPSPCLPWKGQPVLQPVGRAQYRIRGVRLPRLTVKLSLRKVQQDGSGVSAPLPSVRCGRGAARCAQSQ
jgi:hypothetical protein